MARRRRALLRRGGGLAAIWRAAWLHAWLLDGCLLSAATLLLLHAARGCNLARRGVCIVQLCDRVLIDVFVYYYMYIEYDVPLELQL